MDKKRSPVFRERAEDYFLISLVAFGVTVVAIRAFLHFTGYPQVGNDMLHIAHALWGGLLLFVAVLLPILLTNRWAINASAWLSGIGIGLFIDEVGKFISQSNDYFFPPALSVIYGFFLLNVLVYFYFRRPRKKNPRNALYYSLDDLQEALDGDLDTEEAARIEAHLDIAKQSEHEEISFLAEMIAKYLEEEKDRLLIAKPNLWRRLVRRVDRYGRTIGQRKHRIIILGVLISWIIFVISYIAVMIFGYASLSSEFLQWRLVLIIVQSMVGCLMVASIINWVSGHEDRGLKFGIWGILLSLVILQLISFYTDQILALVSTLIQFVVLLILLSYRRWYPGVIK